MPQGLSLRQSRQKRQLFLYLPGNFFSVLAGPLKELHAALLFLVYEEYKKAISTLPKDSVIDLFCEYLEEEGKEAWSQYEEDDPLERAKDVRERANQLLRKLVDAGWLIQETHMDYTYKISLPDYATLVLDTLEKITGGYRMEFRGRVLSIHHVLTGERSTSYEALQQAAELTGELIKGLKSLNHSIKHYTEKLLQAREVRDILSQIFDEYHREILGEQYYRLKTSEHVHRYRTGILGKVRDWRFKKELIRSQALAMVVEKQASDYVEGENIIYSWLNTIEESFEQMDEILEDIDARNARYARAAVEKLRFQLRQGRGMEQKLAAILNHLSQEARERGEKDLAGEDVTGIIGLFPQLTIDESSLRKPSRPAREYKPEPLKMQKIPKEKRAAKLSSFRSRVKEEITVKQINAYISSLLDGKDTLPLKEVPLRTREEWVNLIYIILYSTSHRAAYTLEGERGKTVPLEGGIEVPALVIRRKETAS